MKGKTIRIYLTEGTPTGALTAEIINWTGKVVVAPRSQLADLASRAEVQRTGVYCLTGVAPDDPSRECVYIGEGDNVLKRLAQHDADEAKDFWTRTVVVTSKDENLTKAHVRYLESRLIQQAQQAGRARLQNGTAPSPPSLPEPDVADMEYFLEQISMILPVLGFGFLQPKPSVAPFSESSSGSPLFTLQAVGAKASAREVNGEFVVLKGSTARREGVESWTAYKSQRDQLVKDGKLVEGADSQLLVFAEDVPFASPSAAAAVVLGRNANGRKEWKTQDTGKSYCDWQALQLKLAGVEANDA